MMVAFHSASSSVLEATNFGMGMQEGMIQAIGQIDALLAPAAT